MSIAGRLFCYRQFTNFLGRFHHEEPGHFEVKSRTELGAVEGENTLVCHIELDRLVFTGLQAQGDVLACECESVSGIECRLKVRKVPRNVVADLHSDSFWIEV